MSATRPARGTIRAPMRVTFYLAEEDDAARLPDLDPDRDWEEFKRGDRAQPASY